jgi:hypothetical protein
MVRSVFGEGARSASALCAGSQCAHNLLSALIPTSLLLYYPPMTPGEALPHQAARPLQFTLDRRGYRVSVMELHSRQTGNLRSGLC